MKKLITVFICINFAFVSFAEEPAEKSSKPKVILKQHPHKTPVSLGIKIAPSLSWIDGRGSDSQGGGVRPKLNVGLIINKDFTNYISLQTGFNLNSYGSKLRSLSDTIKLSYDVTTAEIPLLVRLRTMPVKDVTYGIHGGFAAGYIIKSNAEVHNYLEQTKSFTGSYIIGVDITYDLPFVKLIGLLNFNGGLSNLFKREVFANPIRPSFVELGFGVMF